MVGETNPPSSFAAAPRFFHGLEFVSDPLFQKSSDDVSSLRICAPQIEGHERPIDGATFGICRTNEKQ